MYEKNEMKEQGSNELLSGMEKFALKVGKKHIETKYVLDDYTLDFRQSEVFRRNDNDKIDLNNPYFTFEEWIKGDRN